MLCLQVSANHRETVSSEVVGIYFFYHFGLFWNDSRFTIRPFLIGVQVVVVNGGFTTLHGVTLACLNIAGDGFAFRLCKGSHHSQHQLCGLVHGIDVFFFKVDRDTLCFQHSDIVQAVHSGCAPDRVVLY